MQIGDRVEVETGGGWRLGTIIAKQERKSGTFYGVSYTRHLPPLYVTSKRLKPSHGN